MAPITDELPNVSAIDDKPAFDEAAIVAAFDDADVVAAAIMANQGLWCVPGVGSRCAEPFFGFLLVSVVFVVSDAPVCFAELLLFVSFFGDVQDFLLLVVSFFDDFGDAVPLVVFFFDDVDFGVKLGL
jgi:hypothetical protein